MLLRILRHARGVFSEIDTSQRAWQRMIPRGIAQAAPNGDSIAWPEGSASGAYQGYRVPEPGGQRDLDEVPYHELRNALLRIVSTAHGIPEDDALREVAREFGYFRLAAKARARLSRVAAAVIADGAVVRNGVYLGAAVTPSGMVPTVRDAADLGLRPAPPLVPSTVSGARPCRSSPRGRRTEPRCRRPSIRRRGR
ncbi:hypothetical protein [Myceligenerans crystallogenes]|uniref:Uncharacterized protein n=1 Tax=Myceligenerans crystallogenes TaxID=316335 RepID=A0ABN2NNK0_9MICO